MGVELGVNKVDAASETVSEHRETEVEPKAKADPEGLSPGAVVVVGAAVKTRCGLLVASDGAGM